MWGVTFLFLDRLRALQSASPVGWTPFLMGNSNVKNQVGFNGIEQSVGKLKKNFTADSTTNFSGSAGMGHNYRYHPVHLRNESQADSRRFIFVVA